MSVKGGFDLLQQDSQFQSPQVSSLPSHSNPQNQVTLTETDPFDWESYIAPYKGIARIHRLLFLARNSPQLRKPCSAAAIDLIQSTTRDTSTYQQALSIHNTNPNNSLIPASERKQSDSEWVERVDSHNRAEREKLELEMRNYQNNLIKESIRMAHRDLGDHFKASGDLQESLKSYTRTRDFCSTSEHVIEMCLNTIQVSLLLGNYSNVLTFISKAEGVLEQYIPSASANSRKLSSASGNIVPPSRGGSTSGADAIGALFRAGGSSASSNAGGGASANGSASTAVATGDSNGGTANGGAKRQVDEIRAKLKVANGLACLGLGEADQAARILVGIDASLVGCLGEFVSASDLAIYVTLCSLASMDRPALKASVLDRQSFRSILEQETHAREILDAFAGAEFKRVGEILDRYKSRHLLDINLAPHLHKLRTTLIRRAIRQFFTPFDRLTISRLASAFGWTETAMAQELIGCIERGELRDLAKGVHGERDGGETLIDWRRKLVEYKKPDNRSRVFSQSLEVGRKRVEENKRLLLRMRLVENNLIVKAPKEREGVQL
ncbi:hypothetical protein IE53DRAFT_390412 [Violaceomyces palustris]|uniref:Uncharacterized protein n=1 Tax=Violaceomyces palustris TaxID=1673888 RepID=A0ACD0NNU7_9BASI|nr:hypothetical protein IE53DRAFT_390412 [Violaceomyces palustris]